MTQEQTHLKNLVERIEGIPAFLHGDESCEHPVSITVVLVNGILNEVIVPRPYHRADFNDLKSDIHTALTQWFGYGMNEIDLGKLD